MRVTAFFALFAFLRIPTFSRSHFRKSCENHAFYRVFRAARPRFRVRFFVVFARSLFKQVFKTMCFRAFFAFPRACHGPVVFRFRFNSLLFAFCKTLQKPHVFAPFFECGREPCGCFWAPKPHFWLFPSQLVGPNGFRELSGGVRVSKLIENLAFSGVFCVSVLSNVHCALPFFFKHGMKTARFRVFLEPRG